MLDLTTSMDISLKEYREHKKLLPHYAILSDDAYLQLKGEGNIIPNQTKGEEYLNHELTDIHADEKVIVVTKEKLPKEDSEDFERKAAESPLLMILNNKPKLKGAIFCNLNKNVRTLQATLKKQFE